MLSCSLISISKMPGEWSAFSCFLLRRSENRPSCFLAIPLHYQNARRRDCGTFLTALLFLNVSMLSSNGVGVKNVSCLGKVPFYVSHAGRGGAVIPKQPVI